MRIGRALGGALVLAVTLSAALPASAKRAAPPTIAPMMKWEGGSGGPEKEAREVIQDADAFAKSWVAKTIPAEEARKIDFAKHTVLAVATGTRNTGGYAISVTAVYDVPEYGPRRGAPGTPAQVSVSVVETTPGPGAITTQALTSPWAVVIIPKTDKPVKFHVSKRAAE